jgi:hypothetical protein
MQFCRYNLWTGARRLKVTADPGVTLTADHVPAACLRARIILLGPLTLHDVDAASFLSYRGISISLPYAHSCPHCSSQCGVLLDAATYHLLPCQSSAYGTLPCSYQTSLLATLAAILQASGTL